MASETLSIPEEKLGWFIDTMVEGMRAGFSIKGFNESGHRSKFIDYLEPYQGFIAWMYEMAEYLKDFADEYRPSNATWEWLVDMYASLDCEGK